MIVRRKLPLSRILHFVASRIVLFFTIDVAIAVGYVLYGQKWLAVPNLPLSLAGAALTIFLGFRIKAAYDRWWEARILWGGLVNWSRTLARRCQIFPSFAIDVVEREQVEEFQGKMTYWQIAFVNALRCHLRKHDSLDELGQWLTPEEIEELRGYDTELQSNDDRR